MSRLERCAAFARSSRFHLVAMAVWPVLAVPSLTIWRYSITLVIAYEICIDANFVGHWGAYQAAHGEEAQQ